MILKDRPLTDPAQPHICQIGAVLCDETFKEQASFVTKIVPKDWVIDPSAKKVHGIEEDECIRYGMHAPRALGTLQWLTTSARLLIGQNLQFDIDMVEIDAPLFAHALRRPGLRHIDVMRYATLAEPDGRFPSLRALHEKLTGEAHTDAHDSISDARAAMRCFQKLVESGAILL